MSRSMTLLQRILPALLIASGVVLLTAGLIAWVPATLTEPPTAQPNAGGDARPSPRPTSVTLTLPPPTPGPTGTEQASPTTETSIPTPGPTETVRPTAYATRVRVPTLGIDLAVVAGDLDVPGNVNNYPLCDVAMFLPSFSQPGEPGTTYIYAHAQRGMFLPMLRASEVNNGAQLLGGRIEVYTSANELHVYEIVTVKRHATDLTLAWEAGDTEQLILQTSEGRAGTPEKLQVAARPVSIADAAPAEARPVPQPRVCLPPS